MRVVVRLFAQMRLSAGRDSVELDLPEGATASAAVEALLRRFPALEPARSSCLLAVGLDYASPETPLSEGDEVSLIPPVQGG